MTALELLGWISAALLVQVAVGVGVVVRRRSVAEPKTAVGWPATAARPGLAWDGWRAFRVARRSYEDAARTQCSFDLEPVDGRSLPDFRPGQFLTFSLDVAPGVTDATGARRSVTRCYSLSDRPDPAHYRVTIKRVPAPPDHPEWLPGLSSNHFHDHVRAGDELRVKAPTGHFCIDPDPSM